MEYFFDRLSDGFAEIPRGQLRRDTINEGDLAAGIRRDRCTADAGERLHGPALLLLSFPFGLCRFCCSTSIASSRSFANRAAMVRDSMATMMAPETRL